MSLGVGLGVGRSVCVGCGLGVGLAVVGVLVGRGERVGLGDSLGRGLVRVAVGVGRGVCERVGRAVGGWLWSGSERCWAEGVAVDEGLVQRCCFCSHDPVLGCAKAGPTAKRMATSRAAAPEVVTRSRRPS